MNIFGNMGKKQSDHKSAHQKRYLFWNVDIFGCMGRKKPTFPWNVNIFGDMNKKRPFQSDLKKRTFPRNLYIYEEMEYL